MLANTEGWWSFCLLMLCVVTVTGCGGGGGGGGGGGAAPVAAAANSSAPKQETFRVSGSVGDGPIAGADLVFTDNNDGVIATASSDDQASYSVDLPQNSESPIKISATGGTDMVTGRAVDFELLSLISTTETGTANVSPITTVLTQSFDCVTDPSTEISIDEIWAAARDDLTLGLQQAQFTDPIAEPVSPQSAAAFVLVNEALGEVVRRSARVVSEQQGRSEFEVANELIRALGCDLTDGAFDGQSETGTLTDSEKTLLGIVRVMDTLVRLELLTGKLTVDGTDATLKMNAAIDEIQPGSTVGVKDVLLSDNAAAVVLESLSVLASLDATGELAKFGAALDGVAPDVAMTRTSQALEAGLGEHIRAIGPEILTLSIAQVDRVVSLQPVQTEHIAANTDPEAAPSSPAEPAESEVPAPEPVENEVPAPEPAATEVPAPEPVEDEVPAPQPTVLFVASSSEVQAGSYVELDWTTTDSTSCSASGAWAGDKATAGSELIGPVNQASTYTLACDGSGGSAVAMIEVAALGSVKLAWQAPEKNTDGTLVNGLSLFKVYYGTQSRQYNDPIEVSGSKNEHTVELPVGSYYFAVSAIDLEGDESALSNEIVDSAQ